VYSKLEYIIPLLLYLKLSCYIIVSGKTEVSLQEELHELENTDSLQLLQNHTSALYQVFHVVALTFSMSSNIAYHMK
jgi:hypothetical protein